MKHDLRDNKVLHKYRCVAQLGRALRSGRRGRRFKSCHPDHMNEARFSNIFIEKRASTCPQSLEKSRLFSYALLVSECENFQNMKRIFLRKVVI